MVLLTGIEPVWCCHRGILSPRYMASNDRHYANHYATIKKWLDEDCKGRRAKIYTYDDNEGECL